eukprot:symbB.v1.2.010451.t1/scaffold669.1/size295035/2
MSRGRGRGRGRGAAGLDAALPEDVKDTLSPLGEAAWKGEFQEFAALLEASPNPAKDLSESKKDVAGFYRVTPFSLLLERIYRDVGTFSGAQGAKEAIRSAASFGADWMDDFARSTAWSKSIYPIAILLRILINEKVMGTAEADDFISLAFSTGARWVTKDFTDYGPNFQGTFLFHDLLAALCESKTLSASSSLKLLEESLHGITWTTDDGNEAAMRILYEGGGTMFSNVVDLAMRTDLLGTPDGDVLLNFCYKHGATWDLLDGWNQSAFLELLECAMGGRRSVGQRSKEEMFQVVKGVVENHQDPGNLWNSKQDRTIGEASESTFYDMLRGLGRQGLVGVPLGRQYIALAEATGAKWENVAWNYHPPWTVHQKGRLTNLHSLVDDLRDASFTPDGISILHNALTVGGADFAVDDPNPPGPRRFVVNIPKLLWAARRQTLLLVALLCNDRASLDGAVPDGAAHAVVWLAQLAKRQQCEEEPLKVGHPVLRLVMSFLQKVPLVLGYDSTTQGSRQVIKREKRQRTEEEGLLC